MKLLVDTHLLLWSGLLPRRLSPLARQLLEDPANVVIFSVVSIWEIAIKHGRGRRDFSVNPGLFRRGLLDNGYAELTITSEHALATVALPPVHRDPFDRLLVAQCQVEAMIIVTADEMLTRYNCPVRLV